VPTTSGPELLIPSQFSVFQIDLKHVNQNFNSNKVEVGIDLREYYPSVEWDILGVPAERHEKYYPCCNEPYPGECNE
jgi:nicotinic acetylcholine receptor